MSSPDPINSGQLRKQVDSLPPDLQQLVRNALDSGLNWKQISDLLAPILSDGTLDGNELQQFGDFLRELPVVLRPGDEGNSIPPGQLKDFVDQVLGTDQSQRSAAADALLSGDPRSAAFSGAAALVNPNAAQAAAGRETGAAIFANATASAQQAATGTPLTQAPVDRVQLPGAQPAQNARAETVATPTRAENPATVNLQQQAPVVPAMQGRADLLGAQMVLPQVAGAVMLANPQAVAPSGHTGLVVPAGHAAAAAQARESTLVPAGHTNTSTARRQERERARPPQPQAESLLALLSGRRRGPQGEAEPTAFQWLFWILTVVAYGAVAIAVIAMVAGASGSHGLTDPYGELSPAAYALMVAAAAALVSWFVGRRLARR